MELALCHEMSIKAHEIMWQLIFCSDGWIGWIYCYIVGINNPIKTALGSVLTRVVLLLVSQHALFWFEWLRSPAQLSLWCYICRGSQRRYRPSLWHLLNVKVFAEPQTIILPARGPLCTHCDAVLVSPGLKLIARGCRGYVRSYLVLERVRTGCNRVTFPILSAWRGPYFTLLTTKCDAHDSCVQQVQR